MFTAVKAKKHIILNHKLFNESNNWTYDEATKMSISNKQAKHQKYIQYGLAYTGTSQGFRFNTHDKRVYNAVISLYEAGNDVLTPSMIYRQMNGLDGRQGVSNAAINLIISSMDKSRQTHIGIDFENGVKPLTGFLIDADKVEVSTGKHAVTGYRLNDKPLFYQLDKFNSNQLMTVDSELLNVKDTIKRDSLNVILIREYLIRRIEIMKHKKNKTQNRITFDAIYKELDIEKPTPENIKIIRRHTENILLSLTNKKYIRKYNPYKQSRTFKGVEVIY